MTFQFIDANHTQSLANLDLQPFILLKYDSCQLDRKSKKLRRRQKHAQAYSRFLNSKILLPSLIWNKDNHVARTRSKRQTNLCKLEKFQITTASRIILGASEVKKEPPEISRFDSANSIL